jgi:hypothetical protein
MLRWATVLGLGCLAALPLGGCTWRTREGPPSEGIRITAQPPPAEATKQDLYQVMVYFVTAESAPDQPVPDFWRFLDETYVPLAHRRLLTANGLRVAVGGRLAVERLNDTIESSERMASRLVTTVRSTPGQILDVPLGVSMADCTVFCAEPDGAVWGRDFAEAATMVRVHCQASDRPNHTEVTITQEIVYGQPQPTLVPAGRSPVMGMAPPRYRFTELETKVVIREGDLVAVGLMPGKPQSIGDHLFVVRGQGGRRVVTTLLVQPLLVRPGQPAPDMSTPTVR